MANIILGTVVARDVVEGDLGIVDTPVVRTLDLGIIPESDSPSVRPTPEINGFVAESGSFLHQATAQVSKIYNLRTSKAIFNVTRSILNSNRRYVLSTGGLDVFIYTSRTTLGQAYNMLVDPGSTSVFSVGEAVFQRNRRIVAIGARIRFELYGEHHMNVDGKAFASTPSDAELTKVYNMEVNHGTVTRVPVDGIFGKGRDLKSVGRVLHIYPAQVVYKKRVVMKADARSISYNKSNSDLEKVRILRVNPRIFRHTTSDAYLFA